MLIFLLLRFYSATRIHCCNFCEHENILVRKWSLEQKLIFNYVFALDAEILFRIFCSSLFLFWSNGKVYGLFCLKIYKNTGISGISWAISFFAKIQHLYSPEPNYSKEKRQRAFFYVVYSDKTRSSDIYPIKLSKKKITKK